MSLLILASLTAVIVLGATLLNSARLAAGWIRSDPLPSSATAIVVMGGGILPDSTLDAGASERLLHGLVLLKDGVAPRLITTKGMASVGGRVFTDSADQRRLIGLAGALPAWTQTDTVHTTRDEALRVSALLGNTQVVVVTSALHTRRACAAMEVAGLRVSCAPARSRDFPLMEPMRPTERLTLLGWYARERVAYWVYRRRGWV